eukprot:2042187-Prymnesium_polylepis.1
MEPLTRPLLGGKSLLGWPAKPPDHLTSHDCAVAVATYPALRYYAIVAAGANLLGAAAFYGLHRPISSRLLRCLQGGAREHKGASAPPEPRADPKGVGGGYGTSAAADPEAGKAAAKS